MTRPSGHSRFAPLAALTSFVPTSAQAAASDTVANTFLAVAVILILAKLASLVERFGQPAVLGELVMGMLLGNLLLGFDGLEPVKDNAVLEFMAQLGVVILLFQIGLESSIDSIRKVGTSATLVAIIGVVLPFVLGAHLVGPWLMPGLSSSAYLFLGAALTATSIGITGRVFRDMGALRTPEAQIVLGAAVIDDVLGLIILTVVSAIATQGSVGVLQVGRIILEALAFLLGAIVIGQMAAPWLSRFFAGIHRGIGMKFTLLIFVCLMFAYAAHAIGLAPIIGAFAAGLILKRVHFAHFDEPTLHEDLRAAVSASDEKTRRAVGEVIGKHAHHELEALIEPLGHFFIPIFFVLTGMQVKFDVLADSKTAAIALAVSAAAVAGKVAAGLAAPGVNRWMVGWGMVPRGEVGLIFAAIGKSLGVVTEELFSVIVVMVVATTLITPPILAALIKRQR